MSIVKKLIGPILGVVLMAWILKQVDFARLSGYWKSVNLGLLLLGTVLMQCSVAMRAVRWKYILLGSVRLKLRHIYSALMVGFAANWLLPMRMGELARMVALSKLGRFPASTSLASVVTDRLFDMLWLAMGLVCVLTIFSVQGAVIPEELLGTELEVGRTDLMHVAQFSGIVFVGLISFLVVLYLRQDMATRMVRRVAGIVSEKLAARLEHMCAAFGEGLHVLKNWRHILTCIVTTLALWGIAQIGVYALMKSFPFTGVTLTLGGALVLLVSLAAGVAVPNAPGFVGTMHVATIFGLLLGNPSINLQEALAFAIIFHLVQMIPTVLIGLTFTWIDDLSLVPSRARHGEMNEAVASEGAYE
ncbi:lysylphosphatidylglycerol synthase transmembrane domain-containing protein [Candidatus Hydrogenedentota bacterium]